MKSINSSWKWPNRFLLLLPFMVSLLTSPLARAEGSRELTANGGNRPYLEYRNNLLISGIPFRTTMQVFARQGETINLGSSAINIGVGDIVARPPGGGPAISCRTAQPGTGFIPNRAAELAGPFHPVTNTNANAFNPCIITVAAGQEGLWQIELISPNPNGGGNPTPVLANNNWPAQAAGNTFVAAWDVTVRNAAGAAIPGRAFTNYLALNLGPVNNLAINSNVFVQTGDGYRYRVNLNGLDPAGFILFSNNKGYQTTGGEPLYRSVALGGAPTFTLPAGVDLHRPNEPDNPAAGDFTNQIFFNQPDVALLIPTLETTAIPDFRFEGAEGNTPGQAGTSPLGGSFKFTPPRAGNAAITIDANGNDIFTDPEDVRLTQFVQGGVEAQIFWDGRDGLGNIVPPRTAPYRAVIEFTFGEVHFPLIDPENSPNGIIIERLNPTSDFTLYFNDDTTVVTPSEITAGQNNSSIAPRPHRFTNLFGNEKGIDRWSFFIPPPLELVGGIEIVAADLVIVKDHTPEPAIAGGPITYTITVTNNGPSNITTTSPATVSDTVPAEIANLSWSCAIATGNGTCIDATGTGNIADARLALDAGASATYTLTGTVSPTATGLINNTATVRRPDDVTDPVNTDNDTNNDNNRTETDPDTATVTVEQPRLGVAKQLANVMDNGDGTYTLSYNVTVQNQGNVPVNNVQIAEDLFGNPTSTFALAASAPTIESAPAIASGSLTATNANFNGNTDKNLLAGTETLEVGASSAIAFSIRVTPGNNLGPYDNTATASGTSPIGTPVSDISTDGTNPDPDGDGDPNNNNIPTTITFAETPRVGVAKEAGTPTNNGDGTFTVPYTVLVQNLGNVSLSDLQVEENLATTFGTTPFTVVPGAIASPDGLTVNPNFNGNGDNNLLATGNTLAVGATARIQFQVTVTPGNNPGPYNNTATASGTSPGGTPVSDDSTNGTDPDPDGDGDPSNNNEQTSVSFETPRVGVAKEAGTPIANGDGTFSIPYTLRVQNLGNVSLSDLQVVENLNNTFSGVTSFTIESNSLSSTLTVNPSFNGTTDLNLLAAGNTLPVGETATISFRVRVTPGNNFGPYNNTATASGTSPGGTPASDDSTNGTDPNPDGDDDPTNNNVPTTVSLSGTPNLRLVKRVTAINGTRFIDVVDDPTDSDNAANWPNNYLQGRIDIPNVLPGDEVEYTIYFLSDGTAPANNVVICDPLQDAQSFIVNAFEGLSPRDGGFAANLGIALAINSSSPTVYLSSPNDPPDRGRFYASGNVTPDACRLPNPRGAVVVNLESLSPGDFGFVRFRVKVD